MLLDHAFISLFEQSILSEKECDYCRTILYKFDMFGATMDHVSSEFQFMHAPTPRKTRVGQQTRGRLLDLFASQDEDLSGRVTAFPRPGDNTSSVMRKIKLGIDGDPKSFRKLVLLRKSCNLPLHNINFNKSEFALPRLPSLIRNVAPNVQAMWSFVSTVHFNSYARMISPNDSRLHSPMFAHHHESILREPMELQLYVNFKCIRLAFRVVKDANFRAYLQDLEETLLDQLPNRTLTRYTKEYLIANKFPQDCNDLPVGWLLPNSVLQAYSLGDSLASLLVQSSKNLDATVSAHMHATDTVRSRLFSAAVYLSTKRALSSIDPPVVLVDALISKVSVPNSVFCEWPDAKSCVCPNLRPLRNEFGRYHSDLLMGAQSDLKLVHADLLSRVNRLNGGRQNVSQRRPTSVVEALLLTLLEFNPTDSSWLSSVSRLFLSNVCSSVGPVVNGQARSLDRQSARSLICSELLDNDPLQHSADGLHSHKATDCIPQEIVHWIWKADETIASHYRANPAFRSYAKIAMYPFVQNLKEQLIEASNKSVTDGSAMQSLRLYSMHEEAVVLLLYALDLVQSGGPVSTRMSVVQSGQLRFELEASRKPHLRILLNEEALPTAASPLCPVASREKSFSAALGCPLDEFLRYLDGHAHGYWAGLLLKPVLTAENRTNLYHDLCHDQL